jgi:hypothetical protein
MVSSSYATQAADYITVVLCLITWQQVRYSLFHRDLSYILNNLILQSKHGWMQTQMTVSTSTTPVKTSFNPSLFPSGYALDCEFE